MHRQVRFMARSAASYILMLDEQSSQAQNVLHKNAFSDEAAPFHSAMKHCSVTLHNMKHSANAPYDEKNTSSTVCDRSSYGRWPHKYVFVFGCVLSAD